MATLAETTERTGPRGIPGGLREVAFLAYPVVLTNLSVTLLQLVDTAFVGRLGATPLGGVGYGGIWYWTALCFFMGTSTGVQTFVSQAHGGGRERECGAWAWQALYTLVPLAGLALGLFAWVFPTLIGLLGPSADLQAVAGDYVRPRSLGAMGAVTGMALASFFRGIGDTRTPLYAMLVANLVNFVLDYGLIFGKLGLPELGVAGAGAASAIAEFTYAGLMLLAFLRPRVAQPFQTASVPPTRTSVLRLARISAPIGGQWFLEMITFALFTNLVARMGDLQMAASQAFLALLHLSFMQVVGLSVAAGTLVGRYVGAHDLEAAERSYATSQRLGLGVVVVVAALFLGIPGLLMRIFTEDAEVIRLGRPLLAVGAAFQLFDAVAIVASGSLRGAGDTRWPFVVQTTLAWLAFLPLAWICGVWLGAGLMGAWLGGCGYVALLSLALRWRWRSGAWKGMEI
ncbi:MAG: MATE family efflux transporter [Deltaproteobacteria bacterium]|nr:MATE family efflux transporter [Deltaproteobacteria bacterium]